MSDRRWAMFVGSNQCGVQVRVPALKYAENDAREMHALLTDSNIGTFDKDDTRLFLGQRATAADLKAALREIALDSSPSDVLLVYFAGHALVPDWAPQTDAYLGLADLDPTLLRNDPDHGLRMSFLRHDVFELFAGTSFLILDCCHAGAYLANRRQHIPAIDAYGQQMDRHSALLSCPREASSREREQLQHGVLTHELLNALRGAAADADGLVTFNALARHAVEHVTQPTPGHLVPMWGATTTTLTKPSPSRQAIDRPLTPPVGLGKIVPCLNPMEQFAGTVQQLLKRVFKSKERVPAQRHGLDDGGGALERIQAALDAHSAAWVSFAPPNVRILNRTDQFDEVASRPMLEQCLQFVRPGMGSATSLGYLASDAGRHQMLCVPLASTDPAEAPALVFIDPAPALLAMGELLSGTLQAIWAVGVGEDPVYAEVRVLTELRRTFGRLPLTLYDHCLDRYEQLLKSLHMVFQPVIEIALQNHSVSPHSYEALVRRSPADQSAPFTILQIAHAWGDRFIVVRDSILATKAISSYTAANEEARTPRTLPVSINVAVRSLLSDAYVQVIRQAIEEEGLNPHAVMLEISEQDPIHPAVGEEWLQPPHKYFHNRLRHLARELEIGFAVDDFGDGYASLSRMAELPLTQIKVDRSVLHHPLALQEIELVMKVARAALDRGEAAAPRAVIIEGFDNQTDLTLGQLYAVGVRFVQGFGVGPPASAQLRPFDNRDREAIASQIREDLRRTREEL
ncbi:EAL domain-containing protein [Dactylosporangium vinaceum]|uniref:EAL domain-containing protein n=1 Tax=Dactylosporangium vinaceum TaxID=53362 RepID=A0ABV5M209_9ACTN|nr:EAL domain-containing protein [Dactylosporangium vinaceum]UAB99377.1 EAL domain-containing protein [Dactylosporangium vinaceum]